MSSLAPKIAVVVGAGFSGMASAIALSRTNKFDAIEVVERDELAADKPLFRKGVPQSKHVHVRSMHTRNAFDLSVGSRSLRRLSSRLCCEVAKMCWRSGFPA